MSLLNWWRRLTGRPIWEEEIDALREKQRQEAYTKDWGVLSEEDKQAIFHDSANDDPL